MEKDPDLKNLIKAFENQAPELISIESAENIILQKHYVKPYKTRKIMQTTFITSISLTLSFFLFKSYTSSELNKPTIKIQSHTTNEQRNDEKESTNVTTSEINEPSSKPTQSGDSLISRTQVAVNHTIINPNISNPISRIEYDSIPSSTQIKDTAKTIIIDNSLAKQKSNYNFIKLNEDELYKLGIVCRDGGVFYEETFNTKNPFKYSRIKIKNYQSTTWEGGSISILSNLDKYPKLITNLEITRATGVLNRAALKDTLEIFLNHNYFIPVAVTLNHTNIDSLNADAEIFWFPKSPYIINLLPSWAQTELNINPNAFSWDMKENRKYKSSLISYGNASEKDASITLIEKNKYLNLEQGQMQKFGFNLDTTQQSEIKIKARHYTFQSYFKNGTRYNEFNCKNEKAFLKAKEKFKYPFPLYMTDSIVGTFHGDIISLKTSNHTSNVNETQILLLEKSKLIPIKIHLSKSYHQYFWYEYDESLIKNLNEQQLTIAQEILKDSLNSMHQMTINSQIENVKLEEIRALGKSKLLNIHPLKLNINSLEIMGYKNIDENLEITLFDTLNKAIKLTLYKHGTTIDNVTIDTNHAKNLVLPEYISNDLGKYTYVSFKTNAEKDASKIDFNQLIPVLFETNRSYNAIDLYNHAARPNYLLWFKPTPEFLKLLPASEQVQIKSELDSTHKGPCVYSDACKENKVNILKVIAYPNPNKGMITLKVDLIKPTDYIYSIADLSGKTLIQNQVKFQEENNTIDINLSNLENGIYYLYVYTNSGDLIVQKIVVMK